MSKSVIKKLGKDAVIKRLSELDEIEEGQSVVVIGTLFKNQALKPNILKEVGEENAASNQNDDKAVLDKYIDDSDELVLEDELQRARLYFAKGNKEYGVDRFVTGIVCGIKGSMIPSEQTEGGGKFKVEEMFFPDIPDYKSEPNKENARSIAIVSGLNISEASDDDYLQALDIMSQVLVGEIGDDSIQEKYKNFERLIVAGNSLSADTRDKKILSTAKYLTTGQSARSVNAVKDLDTVLSNLASGINVDIMPGSNDPANQNFPQQPLHLCLFSSMIIKNEKYVSKVGLIFYFSISDATKHETLKTVTNPYKMEIAGYTILGTSGQNVEDIMKNSSITDPLDALELILRWSHVAPTCPDTLGCFPYLENDPFVISELPHVLFAGNQKSFKQK